MFDQVETLFKQHSYVRFLHYPWYRATANHAREFEVSGVPQIEQLMGKKPCSSCGMQ
jgi:hypothetical protein